MFAEITCGKCESNIQFDSEWEESVWMIVYRFANAHVACGSFSEPTGLPGKVAAALDAADAEDEDDAEVED